MCCDKWGPRDAFGTFLLQNIEELLAETKFSHSEIAPINFKDIKYSLKRVSTGIKKLDEVLDGGFPSNFLIVLNGEPGSGKTILATHFLMNNKKETSLLFTFEEDASQIARHAYQFGFNMYEHVKDGKLIIFKLNSIWVDDMIEKIKEYKPKHVVIDSVMSFEESEDHLNAWNRLIELLKKNNILCLLLIRKYNSNSSFFEHHSDGVLKIDMHIENNKWKRYLQILKMRGTPIHKTQLPFHIDAAGVNCD